MKTVNDLVSDWTPQEREQFRDLIDECREREKVLIETSRASRETLVKLTEFETALHVQSFQLRKAVEGVADSLFGIYLHFYNKKLPSC